MITEFDGTEHAFLSNFFPAPVLFGAFTYPTVEHAYQAAKTTELGKRVMLAFMIHSPGGAKRYGQLIKPVRPDWEQIKVPLMRHLLRMKFRPGTDLARRLLETGNQDLMEGNAWGDRFWGKEKVGDDWVGSNWLGCLLVDVRQEFCEIGEQL